MRYLLLIICSLGLGKLTAQEVDTLKDWEYPELYRMVSINTTPLVTQLIPFNRSNPRLSGPYNVEFHRFRGNRAFHTSLGLFFSDLDESDASDNIHLNFRMGFERRRAVKERWVFYRGWNVYLSLGGYNLVGTVDENAAVIGMGPRWSIEYRIRPAVSLSIETALVIGTDLNAEVFDMQFIPPVSLNLNFTMPRRYYVFSGNTRPEDP